MHILASSPNPCYTITESIIHFFQWIFLKCLFRLKEILIQPPREHHLCEVCQNHNFWYITIQTIKHCAFWGLYIIFVAQTSIMFFFVNVWKVKCFRYLKINPNFFSESSFVILFKEKRNLSLNHQENLENIV